MAIESAPASLLQSPLGGLSPTAAAAKKQAINQATNPSKAPHPSTDKDPQGFRALLDGVEAAATRSVPVANADVPAKEPTTEQPLADNTASTVPADAAALLAAYWLPVPVAVSVPAAVSATTTALARLAGTAVDANGSMAPSDTAALAVPAADTATPALLSPSVPADALAAVVGPGASAPPSPAGLAQASAAMSAPMASYASVLEQMQSRLAAGSGGLRSGTPDKGVAVGTTKAVPGTAAADIRADAAASLLPMGSAMETATRATESMQWTLRESTEKSEATGLVSDKLPEGLVVQSGFTATVSFDSASISTGAQQQAPEAAIADQVSYWISQGIQNAELTFDGADAQPVQVSISLSGNEAHVEFRTDQLETRDLLNGSAAHLKDLLQSEGMVLSGLSVASSGAGGSQARERRAQAEGQPNTAQSRAEDGVAVRSTAPARAPQGAIDLFV